MKERKERIDLLLERYLDASATDAEEQELRAYFRSGADVPADLAWAETLFGGVDALAAESMPESAPKELQTTTPTSIPSRAPDSIPTPPPISVSGRRAVLPPRWAAMVSTAAATLILGLFVYAEFVRQPYCYIDGVAIYNKEIAMQTTVYLEGFSDFEDPARLVDDLIINN